MSRFSAALLLVATLGFPACSRSSAIEASTAAPEFSAGAAEPAPVVDQTQMRGWQQGQEYVYRFQTTSQIALRDKTPLYDFDLAARAKLLALEVSAFESRIPGSQAEFDRLSTHLKEPYFFELKGGLVTSANVPKDLHPLATAVFRSLSASLQFAALNGAPRVFTTREFDTTGRYESEYAPSADPLLWHKRKLRYLGILLGENESQQAKEIAPKIVESEAEIRLSTEGRPVRITMRDELELASAQAPLHSKTLVSLLAESTAPSTRQLAELRALRDQAVTLAANAPYQSASDRRSLDDAKVDGMTFEKVLGSFEQFAARKKSNPTSADLDAKRAEFKKQADEEARLFVALGALFRSQPNTLQKASTKIKAKSPASDALIDALGSAGTEPAQDMLIALVQDRKNAELLRSRALLSLSRTENPTPASVQCLLTLAHDESLGTEALYGVGNYTRAFAMAGKQRAAETLGAFLIRRLDAAKSEIRIIEALRALANSGFTPAFPKVSPYLKDQREQVRVDAVQALALMTAPEIDATLVERLSFDEAKKVRLAALEAMGGRAPSDALVNGLRENVTADDPHVRYRAVELLIRWLPKRPELRESVQRIAQNDSEDKIRELAKAAL